MSVAPSIAPSARTRSTEATHDAASFDPRDFRSAARRSHPPYAPLDSRASHGSFQVQWRSKCKGDNHNQLGQNGVSTQGRKSARATVGGAANTFARTLHDGRGAPSAEAFQVQRRPSNAGQYKVDRTDTEAADRNDSADATTGGDSARPTCASPTEAAAGAVPSAEASQVQRRHAEPAAVKPQAIPRCDPDAPKRWAAARARSHPYGSRHPPRNAPGCKRALARARSLTAVCPALGCSALVHLQSVTRDAHKAGRVAYSPGDGCASRVCAGTNHRPAKHMARQRLIATAVQRQDRLLVAMPAGSNDDDFQPLPPSDVEAAIARVLLPVATHLVRAPPGSALCTASAPGKVLGGTVRHLALSLTEGSCSAASCAMRLRGGGSQADEGEVLSQQFGDDDFAATQQYGDDETEADVEFCLVRIISGQPAGVAAALPDGTSLHILAIGRQEQAEQRQRDSDTLAVATLQLEPSDPTTPMVSRLHAEIAGGEGGRLMFYAKGQSYSFINGTPLHATSKRYSASMQIYDGDVLRLGGNLSGKTGGDYDEFVYRVDAPALGERQCAAAAPAVATAAPRTAAPSAPAATPTPAALIPNGGGSAVMLDGKPKSRTPLPEQLGFIAATRDGQFDLHAQGELSYSAGAAGSWVLLSAGGQRRLHDGDRLQLSSAEYSCRLPAVPTMGTALPSPAPTQRPLVDGGGTVLGGAPAAASELAALATRQAELTAELVGGLTGKARSEAVRGLGAAHAAHVGVALAAVSGAEPEQAMRIAANQLSKVANDYDKKRRREEKAAGTASAKAQRRDSHAPPRVAVGRAPGGPKQTPAKRDRRTFENRTVQRKKQRVAADERQQQQQRHGPPPPPGQRVVTITGKGGGGKGGSGKGGGGKGGGGKGGGGKGSSGKGGSGRRAGGKGGKGGGQSGGQGGGGRHGDDRGWHVWRS